MVRGTVTLTRNLKPFSRRASWDSTSQRSSCLAQGPHQYRSPSQTKRTRLIHSIKRDISHLCRDFSPPRRQTTPADGPSHAGPSTADPSSSSSAGPSVLVGSNFSLDGMNNPTTQLQRSYSGSLTSIDPSQLNANVPLYSDPNFAPAWPLLPDAQGGMGLGEGPDGWVGDDQTELGALRCVSLPCPAPDLSAR